eukprot:4823077-Amphidinium_carterae.1
MHGWNQEGLVRFLRHSSAALKLALKKSQRGGDLVLAHFDISRAHFIANAQRDIIVELPAEDPIK